MKAPRQKPSPAGTPPTCPRLGSCPAKRRTLKKGPEGAARQSAGTATTLLCTSAPWQAMLPIGRSGSSLAAMRMDAAHLYLVVLLPLPPERLPGKPWLPQLAMASWLPSPAAASDAATSTAAVVAAAAVSVAAAATAAGTASAAASAARATGVLPTSAAIMSSSAAASSLAGGLFIEPSMLQQEEGAQQFRAVE